MSWLFGKKKPPSIEVYVSEDLPEGFVGYRRPNQSYESPLPPYPPIPRGNPDVAAPYPPHASPYPPVPSPYPPILINPNSPSISSAKASTQATNPLDSIPFILAPALMTARSSHYSNCEPIKNQLNHLKLRLNSDYNYDFTLERSVLREHA